MDALSKLIERDKHTNEQIMNFPKMYSGYIGQVMKLRWGGEWKNESEYSMKNGPALRGTGTRPFSSF